MVGWTRGLVSISGGGRAIAVVPGDEWITAVTTRSVIPLLIQVQAQFLVIHAWLHKGRKEGMGNTETRQG